MRRRATIGTTIGLAATTAVAVVATAGTASASAAHLRDAPKTPCGPAAHACVDLSAQQAWLTRGTRAIYGPVPITTGKPGSETPPGTFNVTFKDIDHKSSIFHNAPMPYSVFFNGGIAFHEGSLYVQSNGCVHLSLNAAKTFYRHLSPGEVVQIVP